MSFLYADRKKQIAVVNIPISTDPSIPSSTIPSGLFMTGSLDLLNQASVAGLANATLVGNLTEAANLIYPTNRGSLTYYNGLVIEGLPHIAMSPTVGNFTSGIRDKGIGIGLGYIISSATRIYNRPTAVVDIMASNADVKITGGVISSAGTASLIMAGSKAAEGTIQGFKFDVERLTAEISEPDATLYLRPYNINTKLSAVVAVNYDGNVGIGTDRPSSTLHVVSSLPSVSAVNIENTSGPGLTVKTFEATPLRIITRNGIQPEQTALYVSSTGILGVKMDSSTIESSLSSALGLNTAMVVNGSVLATNSVFAFGSFSYQANTFQKLDSYNVDTISATPTDQVVTWTISFANSITDFNTLTGYTVLISENSGQKLYTNITNKTSASFTVSFTDADGENITAQSFSFVVFVNNSSLYKEASLVQAVF